MSKDLIESLRHTLGASIASSSSFLSVVETPADRNVLLTTSFLA